MEGWRFVFLTVAALSTVTGVLNWLFVVDPSFQPRGASSSPEGTGGKAAPTAKSLWRDVRSVIRIPTFALIIAQVGPRP